VSNRRAAPLRRQVFELKRRQVEATGARRLVTGCGQCRITVEMGAKHAQWDEPIARLLELVADDLVDGPGGDEGINAGALDPPGARSRPTDDADTASRQTPTAAGQAAALAWRDLVTSRSRT